MGPPGTRGGHALLDGGRGTRPSRVTGPFAASRAPSRPAETRGAASAFDFLMFKAENKNFVY
jgi:hypothetical protein